MITQPGDLRQAADLQSDTFALLTDSQDLRGALAQVGAAELSAAHLERAEVTGLLVCARDAELAEVWATDSHRPFAVGSLYVRVR